MTTKKVALLNDALKMSATLGAVFPLLRNGELCRIFVTCPECGAFVSLSVPPFTYDSKNASIGPESVKLPCGWHGYVTNGEWLYSPDSIAHTAKAQ